MDTEKHACTCAQVDEEKLYPQFEEMLKEHLGKPKDLIMALHKAQTLFGYLPRKAQEMIADGLNVSINEICGVASFYAFFSMVPKGRHNIKTCTGTACYVKGGQKIIEHLAKDLGVKIGETTRDRRFSLNEVRCIGACSLAPIVIIDEDVHSKMDIEKVDAVLSKYE